MLKLGNILCSFGQIYQGHLLPTVRLYQFKTIVRFKLYATEKTELSRTFIGTWKSIFLFSLFEVDSLLLQELCRHKSDARNMSTEAIKQKLGYQKFLIRF